ncbi:MAG: LEA type 2 family protein [Vicinamibacteria bacterium]|nr:LEA type 2 family protein [Vicinamibacteria bacterium]
MQKSSRILALVLALGGVAGCATLRTPTLQVESLKMDKVRVTGAGMNVGLRVQNPNPERLLIERLEYELAVNGRNLGRGYYADPIQLDGFEDGRIDTRFAINFLSLPGAVKEVLDSDRAKVQVKGHFYVRQGQGLKKLGFKSGAEVELGK